MKHIRNVLLMALLLVWAFQLMGQQTREPDYNKLDLALQKDFGDKFGFSILIADDNKVLFTKSYGHADTLKTKTVNQRTLFNIASISKSFTTIGIFCLIEQDTMKLTDTIGKFINNAPPDKSSITISHLLSHTSGFEQNYVCDGLENANEALTALLNDALSFPPGTGFTYSNQNFEMLAIIIEKATFATYEEFIRKKILIPLKMKDTYFWHEVKNNSNIAAKNKNFPGSMTQRNWGYIGSGGIYSNVSDLYEFIKAVIESRLISKSNTERLFKEYYRTASGLSIGYGWYINDTTEWNTREIWTRGNEDWGHNAVIRWFPGKNKIIIVCTNSGEIGDKQITGNRIISNYIADFLWK